MPSGGGGAGVEESMAEGGGEVADFELLVLDSLYLNDSSTSVVLRPDCTLESPGYTEQ